MIRCFFVRPTAIARRWIRCLTPLDKACSAYPKFGHLAVVEIERGPDDGRSIPTRDELTDARWPRACQCGYAFADSDHRDIFALTVYVDQAGAEYTNRDRVPGLMFECPWWHDPRKDRLEISRLTPHSYLSPHYARDWAALRPPLEVVTPSGRPWCVDARSSNGDGWTVIGTAPAITAKPSIDVPGYHGFLSDGEFSGDLNGNRPPIEPERFVYAY